MYSKTEKIIVWLTTFQFMNYKRARLIIDSFENLEEFFDGIENHRDFLSKSFSLEEIHELIKHRNFLDVDTVISQYDKLDISVVTCKSETYPELLKETDAYPIMLYCRGDVGLLKSECLAVVGTRRATKYGKDVGSKIVRDVASEGVTIVSGLADGIDTMAHTATLEAGGKTIAVLGSGLLNIYPSTNTELATKIVESGGLIISEYKPSEIASSYHFPVRNRIIAGLSKAVFIVEATEKSGSMHTKNYALDYGREIFALPARVNDIYSVGCNKCIANGQARMLLNSSEILEIYNKNANLHSTTQSLQLSIDEKLIYDCLLGHEKNFDEILSTTKMQPKTLQTMLMRMTLNGIVDKLPNNYYSLIL